VARFHGLYYNNYF